MKVERVFRRFLKAPRFWRESGLEAFFLTLATKVYRGVSKLDAWRKSKVAYRPKVPVISVGNITAGGAGKTPIVALLTAHFTDKGKKVAILSRGYGGKIEGAHQLTKADKADDVGDEPWMLFDQFGEQGAEVWIGADRRVTAKKAEENGADVLILDDGFQHYLLERDVNLVVIDGQYGFGNGRLLPAGPLREPLSALKRADRIIVMNPPEGQPFHDLPVPSITATMDVYWKDVKAIIDRNVVAFCGIGLPDKFFSCLTAADVKVVNTVPFPDHHPYTEADLAHLVQVANKERALLVTTTKDAARLPEAFVSRCHIIRALIDRDAARQLLAYVDESLAGWQVPSDPKGRKAATKEEAKKPEKVSAAG